MTIPHIAFVGYSGSGKTTLATQVVEQLKLRGYRVGVLKHDAHNIQLDVEGKDSSLYTQAGADSVIVSSPRHIFLIEKTSEQKTVEQLLTRFQEVDLIIVEGFKQANMAKLLVARTEEQLDLFDQLSRVVAIVTDAPYMRAARDCPILDINDIDQVTDLVVQYLRKGEF